MFSKKKLMSEADAKEAVTLLSKAYDFIVVLSVPIILKAVIPCATPIIELPSLLATFVNECENKLLVNAFSPFNKKSP